MFAATKLGVFDRLVDGPRSLDELAGALGCSRDGLERLLDACVGLSLLTKSDSRYANSPAAGAYLTSSSPRRFTGYINYSNDVAWQLWSHLEDAVREGSHRWKQTYGWDTPIFSNFFRTEESLREFLMGMNGFGVLTSPAVAAAFDLSPFQRLVDLGSATAHLPIAVCERYPHMRAAAFDLPGAVGLAREMVAASRVADRVEVVEGDFFVDPLPPADLYSLGRILHDWNADKIAQLLRKVFDALPSGGGLLIAEKVLFDDKSGPRWAQMQNLNMLTCTEGKERTEAEYAVLLTAAGFQPPRVVRTDVPIDALLAIKG